ncbi:MAG TPA: GNAT family N-acetyltransferase [Candidatus Limiplasma sp.]|nr:GNAT family N-acetyltransferase [Candidatus Limiplasma sp.]HRX09325.1 GNAT family N-acetyltransferase [Candidatus Limiplasma sp.]
MKIVHANTADLPGILALQYLAYQSEAKLLNDPEIPPLKQTLAELQKEFESGLILKAVDDDGTVIGSVRGYSQDGTFYIGKLIVRPDLQGQGIGTALMTEVETLAASERYELFTSSKSVRNIKLYERLGYKRFKTASPRDGLEFVYLEKILPS